MTSDRELIESCLAGDGESFHGLVERYQDRVYRVAWRYLGSHHDALEVAQETFARAFGKLATYDPDRPFATWLLAVAANRARDLLRRRGRRPERLAEDLGDRPGPEGGPEMAASLKERAERLRAAVAGLDEEKRLAVTLRYFEGMTIGEIAEVTGTDPGTLKVRLFRARKELFRKLGDA